MTRFLLLVLGLFSAAAPAAEAGFPTISYRGGVLMATPAPDHKADRPSLEILETDECSAAAASKTSLRVNGKCEFLRAKFSYDHQEPKSGKALRTLVGFTFSSLGSGHTLMVSGPFETTRN